MKTKNLISIGLICLVNLLFGQNKSITPTIANIANVTTSGNSNDFNWNGTYKNGLGGVLIITNYQEGKGFDYKWLHSGKGSCSGMDELVGKATIKAESESEAVDAVNENGTKFIANELHSNLNQTWSTLVWIVPIFTRLLTRNKNPLIKYKS